MIIRNWEQPLINIKDNTPENASMYDVIEVYVQEPTREPNPEFKVPARPYVFEDNEAVRYITTSPHCGNGIDFGISEISYKYGYRFISCPTTGIGVAQVVPAYTDPFRNPVAAGILKLPGQVVIEKVKTEDLNVIVAQADAEWQNMFEGDEDDDEIDLG